MDARGYLAREDARRAFRDNFTYADISENDIRALEGFIAIECAMHDRKNEDGVLMGMHPSYRKKSEPKIAAARNGGGIRDAYLRVDGSYFCDREAVSFNADGFIGFAGWASDGNVQPFLRAFMRWIEDWMGGTVRGDM